MTEEAPRFYRSREGLSVETLAIRRVSQEFKKRFRLFQRNDRCESSIMLFAADYEDTSGEPKILYCDDTILTEVRPKDLVHELRSIIPDHDLSRHPQPMRYTDVGLWLPHEQTLQAQLSDQVGKLTQQVNTIFPLVSKIPYLAQVRRIELSSINRSGKFIDPVGEVWIAERWKNPKLAQELWRQISKD